MITLRDVKEANDNWFSKSNQSFFGDISYQVLYGRISKEPYLVRYTNAWSDMFGSAKKPHYVINYIDSDTLKIGRFIEDSSGMHRMFRDMDEVKDWLSVS